MAMNHLTENQWQQKWKTCETDGNLSSIKQSLVIELEEGSPLALKSLVHLVHLAKSRHGDTSFDWDSVHTISVICCQNINYRQPEFDKLKFLNTMYHLIRCYIENNLIKESLHLRSFIILTKNNSQDVDHSLSPSYVLLCQLFHSVATKMEEKYISDPCPAFYIAYLDVMKDCIEILTCNGAQNMKAILSFASKASNYKLNDNTDCLYKLFQFQYDVLCLPRTLTAGYVSNAVNDNEVFPLYVNLLQMALETCHKMRATGKTKDVIARVGCLGPLLRSDAVFGECLSFLQRILSVLLLLTSCDAAENLRRLDAALNHLNAAGKGAGVEAACHCVARVLISRRSDWWALPRDAWLRCVDAEALTRLHLLVLEVAEVVDSSQYRNCWRGDEKCPVATDPRVVGLAHFVALTINVAVNNGTDGVDALLPQAEVALGRATELTARFRSSGCVQWDVYWKSVASTSFNLAVACSSAKLWTHSKNLSMQLCQTLLQDQELDSRCSSLVDIWQCFRILSTSYAGLGKYRNSLIIHALALAALPDKQDTILKSWCALKIDFDSSSKLQSCTLHNIYTEDATKLEKIYPAFQLKKLDLVGLLAMEIQMYLKYGLQSAAVSAAITHLAVNLNRGQHLATTLPTLLQTIATRHSGRQHAEKAVDLCSRTIQLLTPNSVDMLCALVQMWYWKFVCQWTVVKNRLVTEMKNAAVPQQTDESEAAEITKETESDNSCKVMPGYSSFTITNEFELLRVLDKAVSICGKITDLKTVEAEHASKLFPILESAAKTYALFANEAQELKSWAVYYKLGKLVGDKCSCIMAASSLLGSLPCDEDEPWFHEASAIERDLADSKLTPKEGTNVDKYVVLVSYWLGRSNHCLGTGQYAEGKRFLQIAQKELPYISYNDRVLLEVRANLLSSRYLALPGSLLDTGDLTEGSDIEAALAAHQKIQAFIKENKNLDASTSNVALRLLLDATTRCSELFLGMRWPRTLRVLLDSVLPLALVSSLATRSARLLSLLARADLLTWQVVGARCSLLGLGHLLGPGEVVTLDAPASPESHPRPFAPPAFVAHGRGCACAPCCTQTLRETHLCACVLRAHLLELCGRSREASEHYQGALGLQEVVERRTASYRARINKALDSLLDGHARFEPVRAQVSLAVRYADFLAVHGEYALARRYNERIVKDSDPHLVQEAAEQRFALWKAVSGNKESRPPVAEECEGYRDARTPTGGRGEAATLSVSGQASERKEDVWFYGRRNRAAPSCLFPPGDEPKYEGETPKPKLVITCPTPKTARKPSDESAFSPFADIGNIELVDNVFATPQQILPPKEKTCTPTTVIRRTKKEIFSSDYLLDQENRRQHNSPLTVPKSKSCSGLKSIKDPYNSLVNKVDKTLSKKDNCILLQSNVASCVQKKVAVVRPSVESKRNVGPPLKESLVNDSDASIIDTSYNPVLRVVDKIAKVAKPSRPERPSSDGKSKSNGTRSKVKSAVGNDSRRQVPDRSTGASKPALFKCGNTARRPSVRIQTKEKQKDPVAISDGRSTANSSDSSSVKTKSVCNKDGDARKGKPTLGDGRCATATGQSCVTRKVKTRRAMQVGSSERDDVTARTKTRNCRGD